MPMTREDKRKNLLDQDLSELATQCVNVARNVSADHKQSDMAHALRVEWVRLSLDRSKGDKTAAEASLKERMVEFLATVPTWMLTGA